MSLYSSPIKPRLRGQVEGRGTDHQMGSDYELSITYTNTHMGSFYSLFWQVTLSTVTDL